MMLSHELELQSCVREKMLMASDNMSDNPLIFRKNICTIESGEAQWGRSLLETIPQNPTERFGARLLKKTWGVFVLLIRG